MSRAGQVPRERRQSTVSDSSKIPVRKSSRNSVGSASAGPPRAHGWQAHDTPIVHPPLGQTGVTSVLNVTLLSGKTEMGLRLELDASGEIFFEELKRVMKRTRRELNRGVDIVRFTPQRDIIDNCCWVSLMEDQVTDDWGNAVDWFNRIKEPTPCKIYAVIEQDGD
jgi:hypothetical protein